MSLNKIVTVAFQINPADNVATLLDDCPTSAHLTIVGGELREVRSLEAISRGHKVALDDIATGSAVIKYGVRIGHATQPIQRGAWVHLHNLASDLDARSSTLDLHSGIPTDTSFAYV